MPQTTLDAGAFWKAVDRLVSESAVRIDRPKGSIHPRFPSFCYPLDYGYLEGTQAIDGGGVDVWRGSLATATVTAVVCTVDLLKRDSKVKLLIGCTRDEALAILATHNTGPQSAILVERLK